MAWQIEFDPAARRELAALDRPVQRRIRDFLVQRLAPAEDPRKLGAAMTGPWKGFWKYRVGDWRMICRLHDRTVTVYLVKIGHRREIYD